MKTENVASIPSVQKAGIEILACGGMWSVESQWRQLSHYLKRNGVTLHARDYPGHGRRYNEGIDGLTVEDYVQDKVSEIRDLGRPMIALGHSLGAIVAERLAEEAPELVSGVITLAHASFIPKVFLPWNSSKRMLHLPYLRAFFSGKGFGLMQNEWAFVADGCQVELGLESGTILRQIMTGVGIKVPRLYDLSCPAAMIAMMDDHVINAKTAQKIAAYHQLQPHWVTGGHFAHCNPISVEHVAQLIASLTSSWQRRSALVSAA